jgi:UPF0755 protein
VCCVAGFFFIRHLDAPPPSFPLETPITIAAGTSIRDITHLLAEAGVVRSATWLYFSIVMAYDPASIKASTYVFEQPLSTHEVAARLTEGDYDSTLVRLTHIEGERVAQLAKRVHELLPHIDERLFFEAALPFEGTLFPETYFIPSNYTETDVIALMRSMYDEQMATLRPQIDTHPLSEEEIITLASIVEREANSPESKRMVAGILIARLEIGMPLQADASIEYVLEKPLAELTPEDLDRESPYNTYVNSGLPPTPIGNPGLEAISAVLSPTESPYLFYITGNDGNFYYAETYAEHQQNIARYLR